MNGSRKARSQPAHGSRVRQGFVPALRRVEPGGASLQVGAEVICDFGFAILDWRGVPRLSRDPKSAIQNPSPYNRRMANPEHLPPEVMAAQFGVGRLTRHLFVCVGPDCVEPDVGEHTWNYLKKRLKELN